MLHFFVYVQLLDVFLQLLNVFLHYPGHKEMELIGGQEGCSMREGDLDSSQLNPRRLSLWPLWDGTYLPG